MRDAIQIEDQILEKDGVKHRVIGLFATTLDKTYIKVKQLPNGPFCNYEYNGFVNFLNTNQFNCKPFNLLKV